MLTVLLAWDLACPVALLQPVSLGSKKGICLGSCPGPELVKGPTSIWPHASYVLCSRLLKWDDTCFRELTTTAAPSCPSRSAIPSIEVIDCFSKYTCELDVEQASILQMWGAHRGLCLPWKL